MAMADTEGRRGEEEGVVCGEKEGEGVHTEDDDPATPVRLAALLGVDWEEGVEKGGVGDVEDVRVLCPAAAAAAPPPPP